MPPTKLTCPQCQATLKLPPNVPSGFKPKCPRCGAPITLPGRNGTGASPGTVSAKTAAPYAAAVPVIATAVVGRAASAVDDLDAADSAAKSGFSSLAALGLILGGGLLLLALTAGLLAICLRDDNSKQDATVKADEPRASVAPTPTPKDVLPPLITPKASVKPLIILSAADQQKIETATKGGVDYLKRKQVQEGPQKGCWLSEEQPRLVVPLGYTALAGLTLLECDVPASDPALQSAAQFVRMRVKGTYDNETYQVSLSLLFLNRLNDPIDRPLIRELALRLVASQLASGGWTYSSPPLTDQQQSEIEAMLKYWPKSAGRGSVGSLTGSPLGAFQPPDEFAQPEFYRGLGDNSDNSNTQFALLAVWSARSHDLPLDPVLRLVAKRFRNSQMPDGSWIYRQQQPSVSGNPTMTAAGLLGIAVGYGLDNDAKVGADMAQDEVLQKGLKVLAAKVGNPGKVANDIPELYFLWSVERVAVLYHLEKIDGKDWYHWGKEILLTNQDKDGRWYLKRGHAQNEVVDTCFALLFLQRANLIKDLTDKLQQLLAALRAPSKKE